MTVQQQPPAAPFAPSNRDGVQRPTSRQQRREERARARRAERAAEAGRKPRRPYGQMLLAVLVIVGCALGAAVAFTRAGDTTAVVVVTGDIARGETIERSDLSTDRVAGVDNAVPADQMDELVGRTATVDLLEGQVVLEGASTADPIPAEGEALVGVSLEAARIPDGLSAGDTVAVLATPEEGAKPDPDGAELSTAQVYSVGEAETIGGTGHQNVTLIVPEDNANDVALYASIDQVALVEVAAGGDG